MCWGYFGPISSNSVDHRNWIGKVIEQYSCLVPFLSERLCYRAPVTSTEWVGRPSFVITKEQLEVMRSYGLSWVEIARALGKPKINFIVKKMFTRSHSHFFFFVMPLFSRMDLFSFLLIHILKRFWTSIRQLGWSWTMFHIRRYRLIRGVSYSFTCNTFRSIWRRHIYQMERRQHYRRRKLDIRQLMDIVAEIKFRNVNSGIIMIEGKLAARSLHERTYHKAIIKLALLYGNIWTSKSNENLKTFLDYRK